MKLPKRIRVTPHVYDVIPEPGLPEVAEAIGAVSADSHRILVTPNQAPLALRDTLVHEVLHCCIAQTSLRRRFEEVDKNFEEDLVTDLAPRLLAVLRENPELVSFLLD